MHNREKIIIALDYPRASKALALVDDIADLVTFFKVGLQLYNAEGPRLLEELKARETKIFLDLKFHDIPNTVAEAAAVAVNQGVDMFNMHLSGGGAMVKAAVERAREKAAALNIPLPKMVGVTVLTSLTDKMLKEELAVARSIEAQVLALASMGKTLGLDGVVASPHEIQPLRRLLGEDFLVITPGVRPVWASSQDQQRVLTPREALERGADYLVIGRPVTRHPRPREAIEKIIAEIEC